MRVDVREAAKSDIPDIIGIWWEFMTVLRHTNLHYWKVKNGQSAFTKYLEEILPKSEDLIAVAIKEK